MLEKGKKEEKGIEYYMQLPYSILLHEIEDEGEKYWIADIPELSGCRSHGSTVDDAVKSVEEAKKDWILDSLEEGEEIPVPIERDRFSGKTLVRMSRSLHRALSFLAESEKLSLNQLIVTILAKEVGRLNVLNRVDDKMNDLLGKVNNLIEQQGPNILMLGSPDIQSVGTHGSLSVKLTGDTAITLGVDNIAVNLDSCPQDFIAANQSWDDIWSYNPQRITGFMPRVRNMARYGKIENAFDKEPGLIQK